jgi:hypothetical protein
MMRKPLSTSTIFYPPRSSAIRRWTRSERQLWVGPSDALSHSREGPVRDERKRREYERRECQHLEERVEVTSENDEQVSAEYGDERQGAR